MRGTSSVFALMHILLDGQSLRRYFWWGTVDNGWIWLSSTCRYRGLFFTLLSEHLFYSPLFLDTLPLSERRVR